VHAPPYDTEVEDAVAGLGLHAGSRFQMAEWTYRLEPHPAGVG